MADILLNHYLWIKSLHIISMIAWMAAMLYLPRLFVYHAQSEKGSDQSETFKIMERRLLRFIANPAMISTWLFGILLVIANPAVFQGGWMHAKFTCVILLSAVHGILAKNTKKFAADANVKSPRYFRILNEIPTILMVVIVIMVVVKPF